MSGREELDPDGVKISVWTDCKAARLHVDRIDRKKVALGSPGILATYAFPKNGLPGLLLLADEPDFLSMSVANCALPVVGAVMPLLVRADLKTSNICTLTTSGFEWLAVTWRGNLPRDASVVPVRWPETPPASRGAFAGVFGIQAKRVLQTMDMLRRNPWRPIFP